MPKITSIEDQKRNKKRKNIYIDGKYAASADSFVVQRNKWKEGVEVDEAALKRIAFEDSIEKAKVYVANWLLGKTKKAMADKLIEKGYEPEVVSKVMEDFVSYYNLADDKDIAKRVTANSVKNKKHGKRRIKQTLKQKGVGEADIEEALAAVDESEELEAAAALLGKKREALEKKAQSSFELKGKCYMLLANRGYSQDIIEKAINRVLGG